MQTTFTGTLRREFASRTQAETFQFFQQQEAEQRKQRERREDADKETGDLIDLAVTVISTAQAREFRLQIDRYDTATVNALYENEQELERVQAQLDLMLADAHVLPDGRRVFKTEDGLRVFDEHGKELSPDLIDPEEIADHLPRWERYKLKFDQREALIEERSDLLEYQDKLDAARERLDAGDMTQAEYDRLQQDLVNEMPDAVRRQIPELADMEPEVEPQVASADNELDISDEHIPSKSAPQAPIPGG